MCSEEEFNTIKIGDLVEFSELNSDESNTIYSGEICYFYPSILKEDLKNLKIAAIKKIDIDTDVYHNGYELWMTIYQMIPQIATEIQEYFFNTKKIKSFDEINKIYNFKSFNNTELICNYNQILSIKYGHVSTKQIKYGFSCLECTEYNKDAMANCKDEKFMCYRCRSWNKNKFEELKS